MNCIQDLYLINYCHPNCVPLKNIMRLPQSEAYKLASKMAAENQNITAYYRFADFKNYYPRRAKTDDLLYREFIKIGGNPKTRHPLSFVLQGSDYLNNWFDSGVVTSIPLSVIPSDSISFTMGDSMKILEKRYPFRVLTKEMLIEYIDKYDGTIDEFLLEIKDKYYYIEAQLWNDDYCRI